jgi:hypothetical protein
MATNLEMLLMPTLLGREGDGRGVEGQSHKMRRGLQMALGGVAQGRISWGDKVFQQGYFEFNNTRCYFFQDHFFHNPMNIYSY